MARRGIAPLIVAAVLAAACSSGSDGAGTAVSTTASGVPSTTAPTSTEASTTAPPTTEPAPLTASFRGVTEDTIRVGVLSLDWQALADLGVNLGRGTSDDLYLAAFEAINDRGGVHGRMLELYPITVFPVGTVEQEAACIELTEDVEIFVLVGASTGDSVLCYTEQHLTAAVVAGSRTPDRIERSEAPYATILGAGTERAARFVELMEAEGVLDGATIGILGSVDVDEEAYHTVFDAFVEAGYEPVPGLIGGNQDDLVETASEQGVIFERMGAAGVDVTVNVTGIPLSMANAIEAGYETERWLLYTLMSTTGLRDAGVDLDYLDGAIAVSNSLVGTSAQPDIRDDVLMDECIAVLDAGTGRQAELALDAEVNDLPSYVAACSMATVLERGLTNAGPDLTNESLQAGLEAIGDIELPTYHDSYLDADHLGAVDGLNVAHFDASSGIWELDR